MRKKALTFFILMFSLIMFSTRGVWGDDIKVSVTPSSLTIDGKDSESTVNVNIEGTDEIARIKTFNVFLDYNTEVLEVLEVKEGALFANSGHPTFWVEFEDERDEHIHVVDAILGNALDVEATGTLFSVKFKSLVENGVSGLNLGEIKIGVLSEDKDETVYVNPISKGNGEIIVGKTIGGVVFNDFNGNGTQEGNEPGVGSVEIKLTGTGPDGTAGTEDDFAASTATAQNGIYSFIDVADGTYNVEVIPPNGYVVKSPQGGKYENLSLSRAGGKMANFGLQQIPSEPQITSLELVTHDSAKVTWTPPETPLSPPVTMYVVQISVDNTQAEVSVPPPTTSYTATNLLPSRNYSFQVRARNTAGLSPFSEAQSVITPGVPSKPTITFAASETPTSVKITWTASTSHESAPITKYLLEMKTSSVDWEQRAYTEQTTYTYTVTKLQSKTEYSFRVRANNDVGYSHPSDVVLVTTLTAKYTLTVNKSGSGSGTVTSTPAGISCGDDCSEIFEEGTQVILTATPDEGSTFAGWTGSGRGRTGQFTITINADTTVTATFTKSMHTLTVNKSGNGSGTVTSSPAGITCGDDCSETFDYGTEVTLTATPDEGSTFAGWSGEADSNGLIMMNGDRTVTATFTKNTHTLAVNKSGGGSGTVTSSPVGITCGDDCSETFDYGTEVTLTATPDEGSTFTGWTGSECTGKDACTLTIDSDKSVEAIFNLVTRMNTPPILIDMPEGLQVNENTPTSGCFDSNTGIWYVDNPNACGTSPMREIFKRQQSEGTPGNTVNFQLNAYDAEGDDLIFEIVGAPRGSDFNPINGVFTWTPGLHDGDGPKGFHLWSILFRVKEVRTDTLEPLFDEKTVQIRVDNVNGVPGLATIENREVTEGDSLSIQLKASDFDGEPISFEADNLPTGAQLLIDGEGNAKIEWTPSFTTVVPTEEKPALSTDFVITVRALDLERTVVADLNSRSFTISVNNKNRSPALSGELSNQLVSEGGKLEFPVAFTDPDGDAIALTLEDAPETDLFTDNGDGTGTFSWQTDYTDSVPEGYQVTFVAKDTTDGETRKSITMLVSNVNQAPEFTPISPINLTEKETRTITLSAIDKDNPPEAPQKGLTFELVAAGSVPPLPKGTIQVAGDKLLINTQLGDAAGSPYALKLRVSDADGGTGETTVELTIGVLNLPPEIEPIPPIHNGVEGGPITIEISAIDPNNDFLTLKVESTPETTGSTFEAGIFSWTPDAGQAGEYNLTFTATETSTATGETIENPLSSEPVSTKLVVISSEGPVVEDLVVDGHKGTVAINFNLTVPQGAPPVTATISVNDIILETLENLTTGAQSVSWDTTTQIATDSITEYKVSITVEDVTVSIEGVPIDNQEPTVTTKGDIEVSAGDLVTFADIQAPDNDQVEQVEVLLSNGVRVAASLVSGQTYQAQYVMPADIVQQLLTGEIGTLTYAVEAIDRAGNKGISASATITITDDVAPRAQITPTKRLVKQGDEVTFDASGSTDNSGVIVEYAWDLDASDGLGFDLAGPSHAATATGRVITFTAQKSVEVTLQVMDPSGNHGTTTASVEVIDLTPPDAPVLDAFDPEITSARDVTVRGVAEPKATIEMNFSGAAILLTTTADDNGYFEATTQNLADGTYSITAVAKDASSNTSVPSAPVILTVDGVEPEIKIEFASDNPENKIASLRPNIPVTVGDKSAVVTVTVRLIEEGPIEVSIIGGSQRSFAGEKQVTIEATPTRDLIDGVAYSLEITATDIAGNNSTDRLLFSIDLAIGDKTAPQFIFVSPPATGLTDGNPAISILLIDHESGLDFGSFEVGLEGAAGPIEDLGTFTVNASSLKQATVSSQVTGLEPGEYQFTGAVKDKNGNIGAGKRIFTVLGKPPVIELDADVPAFVASSPLTISGTIGGTEPGDDEIPAGVRVEISVNGSLTTTANIDQKTGAVTSSVPLVEGRNQLILVTINAIGLRSEPTTLATILDTQTPQVSALLPKDGSSVIKATEIQATLRDSTIASSVVSGINAGSIEVTLNRIDPDSQSVLLGEQKFDPASGRLTVEVVALSFGNPDFPTQKLTEELSPGKYTVSLQVEDNVGNTAGTEHSTFDIVQEKKDLTKPEIFAINPPDGSVLNGEELGGFVIRTSIYDESGLEEVRIKLDGAPLPLGLEGNPLPTGNATWTFEFGGTELRHYQLSDGAHLLTIYAKDRANPANEQGPVNVNFTIDTSIQEPVFDTTATSSRQTADGTLLLNDNEATLAGTAEPNADVAFSVNGQPLGTTVKVDANGRFSKSIQLFDGVNEIFATATKGGNRATSNPLRILVDALPPTIGNARPEPGFRTKETTIMMSVEISERNPLAGSSGISGSGIDSANLTFVLDGNRRINDFNLNSDNGQLSYTTDLAEGSHFFSVTAVDFAGNRSNFNSGVFTVDVTAPTVSHILPEDGATISNPNLEISAIIEDDDVQSVGLQLFPAEEPATQIAGKVDFNASTGRVRFILDSPLADGTYQGAIQATDTVGNASQPQAIIFGIDTQYVDSIAPDVIPLYPKPEQTISTYSIVAISFEVIDADSGVDFNTMEIKVNGEVVDMTGGAVVMNRETGEVVMFLKNRHQFSPTGGLRDPLELGQLENSLGEGVNTIAITVGDKRENFRSYYYTFKVTIFPPSVPVLNFGASITQRPDGTRYTHLAEIPVTGEVPDVDVTGASKVEILVNESIAGIVPVEQDGTFHLERALLTPGDNQITAFAISESGLQSDSSIPQVVVLDTTPPRIECVDLPRMTADAAVSVRTRYRDNTATTPESITLTVNGERVTVDTQQNETVTTVELTQGENRLTLSAMDAAGNVCDSIEAAVTVDSTPPMTAPENLRAGITFRGTEIVLNWDADPNASAYNLYRSPSQIVEVGGLTPIASNLSAMHFTDINANIGVTYYYALTSSSGAGIEGIKVSDNVNITILFAPRGGTAIITDGTRLTAPASGISEDPTLYTGVSIETPSVGTLPPLSEAIDGTARRFFGTTQTGSLFTDQFALPATIALPYPLETESLEELQVFFLDNGAWTQLEGVQVDTVRKVIIVDSFQFGTYQLAMLPACKPWDINCDNVVDISDLVLVGSNFGKEEPGLRSDVNNDGVVDIADLVLVGKHLGE